MTITSSNYIDGIVYKKRSVPNAVWGPGCWKHAWICEFLHETYFTECISPPTPPPPTGSFFYTWFFLHIASSLFPHMRFLHESFLQGVFFSSDPPRRLVVFLHLVFYTLQVLSSHTCVFLHESFFTECFFFLRPPRQLVVFFTPGLFYTMCVFSPSPTSGFFTRVFLQSVFFPLAPPPTGSFLH